MNRFKYVVFTAICAVCLLVLFGCGEITSASSANSTDLSSQRLAESDIAVNTTYDNTDDGEHAIVADNETADYNNVSVTKTGEASGDEADFYGKNAAIFATNGATVTLSDLLLSSDGAHANGVFSYGEGTNVTVSHSLIKTSGNCSGGLMTTGGGIMKAKDVTVETTGNSSAPIRSDRGGGTVTIDGGWFKSSGVGSPVVYSTADTTVNNAYMESAASQGVVVEGKNSATLNGCQLIADNEQVNGSHTNFHQAVMVYQSMSGDASVGQSSFSMSNGSLENVKGDIFFVTNTSCKINLSDVKIVNKDDEGVFLRAEAAGWGNEGSNGGKADLTAVSQSIDGGVVVDEYSALNFALTKSSTFNGAINASGQAGEVYVELDASSTWTLSADSYVTSLTCSDGAINLNGHKLFIDGKEYSGGASTGAAVDTTLSSGDAGAMGGAAGAPPEKPGEGGSDGGTPPEKPGEGNPDGKTPPEKPGEGNLDDNTPPEKPSE